MVSAAPAEAGLGAEAPPYRPGLEGVPATQSSVCDIDGQLGRLTYRGYSVEELAQHSTFLETTYLLIWGELPTAAQLLAEDVAERAAQRIHDADQRADRYARIVAAEHDLADALAEDRSAIRECSQSVRRLFVRRRVLRDRATCQLDRLAHSFDDAASADDCRRHLERLAHHAARAGPRATERAGQSVGRIVCAPAANY